jgi:hypothetical protein
MNQEASKGGGDEMLPEYDIRGGIRGKYYEAYMATRTRFTMTDDSLVMTTNAGSPAGAPSFSRSFTLPPTVSPAIAIGTPA